MPDIVTVFVSPPSAGSCRLGSSHTHELKLSVQGHVMKLLFEGQGPIKFVLLFYYNNDFKIKCT